MTDRKIQKMRENIVRSGINAKRSKKDTGERREIQRDPRKIRLFMGDTGDPMNISRK
jgi:hypothetical protein